MNYLSIAEATAFWGILLWLMYVWNKECIFSLQQHEKLSARDGAGFTNFMLTFNGFIALGLPVIETGLWLDHLAAYAWIILAGHLLFTLMTIFVDRVIGRSSVA